MAGNVWEWTHSLLKEYPYKFNDGRENEMDYGYADMEGNVWEWKHNWMNELNEYPYGGRVLRGGSFLSDGLYSRCAGRFIVVHDDFNGHFGFRVVAAPKLQ